MTIRRLRTVGITEFVFGQHLLVAAGDRKLADHYFKEITFGEASPVDEAAEGSASAYYFDSRIQSERTNLSIIWLEQLPTTTHGMTVLVHEISHVVDRVLARIDIPPGENSTEVRARLTEFYFGSAMRGFRGKTAQPTFDVLFGLSEGGDAKVKKGCKGKRKKGSKKS